MTTRRVITLGVTAVAEEGVWNDEGHREFIMRQLRERLGSEGAPEDDLTFEEERCEKAHGGAAMRVSAQPHYHVSMRMLVHRESGQGTEDGNG
jgi:uncharacterized protein (DUF1786 family)